MAKKTSLPAGFTSKTNYQTLPSVPAGQKVNATTEWNLGIQDLADTADENYERLVLNWTNDIVADQVLTLGQYVDYNDVIYRVTTGYDVSDPKNFTIGNFQVLNNHNYGMLYIDLTDGLDTNTGSKISPFKQPQAAYNKAVADGLTTATIKLMTKGTYGGLVVVDNSLTWLEIIGDREEINLGGLSLTDNQVHLENIDTVGGTTLIQTGSNNVFVEAFDSSLGTIAGTLAGDRFNMQLQISGRKSSFTINASSPDLTLDVGTDVFITLSSANISLINTSTETSIRVIGTTVVDEIEMYRGTLRIDNSATLEVTTSAIFSYLKYQNKANIIETGTVTHTSAEWASTNFDNKIWYVNLNDGVDTNSGLSEGTPLLTLQEAIDLREADAVAHGIIQILTPGVISGINFPASTKTTTLICTPGQNSNNITLTVTDYTFLFIINGSINITFIQTGSNTCKIQTTACSITLSADAVINDPTEAFLILTNNTLGSLLRSFNGYLIVKFSYLQIQGSIFGDITINRLKIEIQAEVEVKNGTNTFTTFELFRAKLTMSSGLTLNIGTFTDTGAIFQINGAALNVTGTRTSITGEFESPHPKSLNKEITADQTVVSNVEFLGQASANDDTIQTFSATPTFDFDNGNDQEMPVTGNITTFSTSNSVGSANYKVWLINDATAGRTVAAPTGWTKAASSDDHDTAANAINLYQFFTRPGGQKYYSILNM